MPQLLQRFRLSALFLFGGVIALLVGAIQLYPDFTTNTEPVVVNKNKEKQSDQNINKEVKSIQNISNSASESGSIVIDVAGAVEQPGVYTLPKYSRINDALIQAGGISKKGDKSWVGKNLNLATKLEDGDKIFIPALGEVRGTTVIPTPAPSQRGSIPPEINTPQVAGVTTEQPGLQKAPPAVTSTTSATPSDGKININTAAASELDILPGIGAVTAQKIIDHRPYTTLEELKEKKAVNKSTFEKIKDKIKL